MPTAENAVLEYEAGQTSYPMAAMTDSGDHTIFTSAASPWSGRSGFTFDVRPNGIITGGAITPKLGTQNVVTVSAGSAYVGGVKVDFSAADVTVVRAADTDTHIINSIVLDASGNLTAVQGTDHIAFIETRAGVGGPALIDVAKVEVGQVRLGAKAAAVVAASEIFTVPNVHRELARYPVYEVDAKAGTVAMKQVLPMSHVGPAAKAVHASFAVPSFSEVPVSADFKPPEESISVSSKPVYGGTEGSMSRSLSAGSFTAYPDDGVSDPLVELAGENLWFRFYPDRDADPHIVCQGYLGIARTFPAGDSIAIAGTIAARRKATNVVG